MAGPWERYQSQEDGPWKRYATTPQPSEAAPEQPSMVSDVLASGASGAARGAADLVGLPGTIADLGRGALQWGMQKGYGLATGQAPDPRSDSAVERFFAGPTPEMQDALVFGGKNPLGGEVLRGGMAAATGGATDYQPQTTAGEYARTAGEFLPAAAAFGGASLPNLARYGLAPAVASETAGQATEGTMFEPYARVAGAIAGGAVGSQIGRGGTAKMPTASEIKASAGYADLKAPMQAARINKQTYKEVVGGLKAVADDFGMVPELHGPVQTILLRHSQKAGKGGATLQDLEILRRSLLNAGKTPTNPSAGELSRRLIDQLDESIGALSGGNLQAVKGQSIDETLGALRTARETWRTGTKAQVVETAIERAQNTASGVENGLRVEFRKILNSPKLAKQFSQTERLAMQQVVKGNFTTNAMRWLGSLGLPLDQGRNFLGSAVGGGAGAAIGSAVAGPVGAAVGGTVLPAIGTAAKAGASRATQAQARLAEALVKAGPNAERMFAEALAASQAAGRAGLLRAGAQSQSAVQVPRARERAR